MDINTHSTLKTGLAGYWTLDQNLNDSHSGGHHGTFYHNPSFPVAKLRTGVSLNGVDQYGTIPYHSAFNGNQISVAFWFSVQSFVANQTLLGQFVSGHEGFNISAVTNESGGAIRVEAYIGGSSYSVTSTHLLTNKLYHAILTIDLTTDHRMKLYINGTEVGYHTPSPTSWDLGSRDINLGRFYDGNYLFYGILDELGYWTKILSSQEIADLYNGGVGITYDGTFSSLSTHPSLKSGLLLCLPLDGNATDYSGHGNDGTLVNSPTFGAGKLGQSCNIGTGYKNIWWPDNTPFKTDNFSFALWVKANAHPARWFKGLFDIAGYCDQRGESTRFQFGPIGYEDYGVSGYMFIVWDSSGAPIKVKDPNTYNGAWVHWAGTFDGSHIRLYRNGALILTSSSTVSGLYNSNQPMRVGYRGNNFVNSTADGVEPVDASIDVDQVMYSDHAWTLQEIVDLYNAGNGLPLEPSVSVSSAAATGLTTVQVTYDGEVHHSNASNTNDALHAANYALTASLANTLVACYTLSNTLVDAGPNSLTGTGEGTIAYAAGRVNNGLCLTGTGDVNLGTSGLLRPNAITVSAWVYGSGMGSNDCIVSKSGNTSYFGWILQRAGTKLRFACATNNSDANIDYIDSVADLSDGTWNHCVGIFDGTNISVWLNGVCATKAHTSAGNISNRADALSCLIGSFTDSTGLPGTITGRIERFHGTIDEVYIHGRALSTSEIASLRNQVVVSLIDSDLAAQSVSLHQASPTIVDVTISGTQVKGEDYTATVSNVLTLADQPLGTHVAHFMGVRKPWVEGSASLLDSTHVKIHFDSLMYYNSALTDAANYDLDGPSTLTVQSVVAEDISSKTYVTLQFSGEMQTGEEYTVTASNVVDAALQLPLDTGHNSATFTGGGAAPQVNPTPVSVSHTTVVIDYSEPVLHAQELTSYLFDPELNVVSVDAVSSTRYRIHTGNQTGDESYELIVSSDVTDLVGNPIDPAHDTVSFTGVAGQRPTVTMYPLSGSSDISTQGYMYITAKDPDDGIDESTWDISFSSVAAVAGGTLQSGFDGTKTGDPDDPDTGVTWQLRPSTGWASATSYTIVSDVQDNEGNHVLDTNIGWFATATPTIEPVSTDETILASQASWYPDNEILKTQLLSLCSANPSRVIRARTLLHLACLTPTGKQAVLQVTTLYHLAGMKFLDATPIEVLWAQMYTWMPTAQRVLRALVFDSVTKAAIKADLEKSAPRDCLAAMAALSVLASFQEKP